MTAVALVQRRKTSGKIDVSTTLKFSSPFTRQVLVNHASISTTLNIYTHVVDASHRKAVEPVEERLFVELDPNGPTLAIVPRTARSV